MTVELARCGDDRTVQVVDLVAFNSVVVHPAAVIAIVGNRRDVHDTLSADIFKEISGHARNLSVRMARNGFIEYRSKEIEVEFLLFLKVDFDFGFV